MWWGEIRMGLWVFPPVGWELGCQEDCVSAFACGPKCDVQPKGRSCMYSSAVRVDVRGHTVSGGPPYIWDSTENDLYPAVDAYYARVEYVSGKIITSS